MFTKPSLRCNHFLLGLSINHAPHQENDELAIIASVQETSDTDLSRALSDHRNSSVVSEKMNRSGLKNSCSLHHSITSENTTTGISSGNSKCLLIVIKRTDRMYCLQVHISPTTGSPRRICKRSYDHPQDYPSLYRVCR